MHQMSHQLTPYRLLWMTSEQAIDFCTTHKMFGQVRATDIREWRWLTAEDVQIVLKRAPTKLLMQLVYVEDPAGPFASLVPTVHYGIKQICR